MLKESKDILAIKIYKKVVGYSNNESEVSIWCKILTKTEKFLIGRIDPPLVDIKIEDEGIQDNHLIICKISLINSIQFGRKKCNCSQATKYFTSVPSEG